MFDESSIGESCDEVVIDVSSPSLELIDRVFYSSLELVPACFSYSPASPSPELGLTISSKPDGRLANPT